MDGKCQQLLVAISVGRCSGRVGLQDARIVAPHKQDNVPTVTRQQFVTLECLFRLLGKCVPFSSWFGLVAAAAFGKPRLTFLHVLLSLVRKSLLPFPQFFHVQRIKWLAEDLVDAEFFEITGRRGLHHEGRVRPAAGSSDRYHLFADRD
jgi:hypothetical protein